ncbi:Ankyrin repeat protein [Rutstroemia sp. NJR-2017a BVV2]|nr:Ankyrin repeat protein [Rutstroemia sp. NJR-2017a BVV2]
MEKTALPVKSRNEYTVGWVCALPKEQTAATAMLDQRHAELRQPPNDFNTYTLGSIGGHNIVIACLPKGKYANNSAASVATHMIDTFPCIKIGLMVGVGQGVSPKVRLGDVVVSIPVDSFPGVVQWDLGKETPDGFERTGALNHPPLFLLTKLGQLETKHEMEGSDIPKHLDEMAKRWPNLATKYLRAGSLEDVLFKAKYDHVVKHKAGDDGNEEEDQGDSCQLCDKTQTVKRDPPTRGTRVHYGLIASGNTVINNAKFRNKLNKGLGGNVLCVETEAAGLMSNFPCVVIRGICDYADSHKNKDWQEHAAAVAAAFAKELLNIMTPDDLDVEPRDKESLSEGQSNTHAMLCTD